MSEYIVPILLALFTVVSNYMTYMAGERQRQLDKEKFAKSMQLEERKFDKGNVPSLEEVAENYRNLYKDIKADSDEKEERINRLEQEVGELKRANQDQEKVIAEKDARINDLLEANGTLVRVNELLRRKLIDLETQIGKLVTK